MKLPSRDLYLVEHIGNPRGRIAVWLDEGEAIDLAHLYGSHDGFYAEVMQAVERAYPKPEGSDRW